MSSPIVQECDIVLVGSGIMSATLAALLKEAQPSLNIQTFERLGEIAKESTEAMNNAGTGHAAFCELNYTPEKDGKIDISKAISINESFEQSLQLWSYLVGQGRLPQTTQFLNPTPHMSLVWGEGNVAYLRQRFELLSAHPFFKGMEYTEDHDVLRQWMPLVMEGRTADEKLAATRMLRGTDVDFGALSRFLFQDLQKQDGFALHMNEQIQTLHRLEDGRWEVHVKNLQTGAKNTVLAKFVFLGAGGGALPLLAKSGIPEGKGYGGFPVSGQWLVCTNPEIVEKHAAKVYGKASVGAPPMSVPHLDTRIIDGKKALLFGPYAGFSTKFLKNGSYFDLPFSINASNLWPMLAVGRDNMDLTKYLIGQVLQSPTDRLRALQDFMPTAKAEDWTLEIAGQRVQIIKKDAERGGKLEFGTEVVAAADGSLAALLGASPGASTAVTAMLGLMERCFKDQIQSEAWQSAIKKMIPSYGKKLANEPELLEEVRTKSNQTLGLHS